MLWVMDLKWILLSHPQVTFFTELLCILFVLHMHSLDKLSNSKYKHCLKSFWTLVSTTIASVKWDNVVPSSCKGFLRQFKEKVIKNVLSYPFIDVFTYKISLRMYLRSFFFAHCNNTNFLLMYSTIKYQQFSYFHSYPWFIVLTKKCQIFTVWDISSNWAEWMTLKSE